LQAIFNRIEAGNRLSQRDLQMLVAAVRSQQVTIATGERAVAIGGNADGAVIVTGDNNVIGDRNLIIKGANAEAIRELMGKRSPIEIKLLRAVKQEVASRLNGSLHKAVLIQLNKEFQIDQVIRPWESEIKIGGKPAEPMPESMAVLEVFDREDTAGKLLILGSPGSGKTTVMLELAKSLTERATEHLDYPIPVLLNLSLWKDGSQPIRDWLLAEIISKYGFKTKTDLDLINQCLDARQLLPMLDGLDEVEPLRQATCVQAINDFLKGENPPEKLVVCSRNEEYSNNDKLLQLNGAIHIQALTNEQIRGYLSSTTHQNLWESIFRNSDLLELVRVPLFLSVMVLVLAYQEINFQQWQALNDDGQRQKYLLNAYVQQMLSRPLKIHAYGKKALPSKQETLHWLIWVAKQLENQSQTEFLIEEIQPALLKSKAQIKLFRVGSELIVVSLMGLYGGLTSILLMYLYGGYRSWLIGGLGLGLLIGSILGISLAIWPNSEKIETVTTLQWSWQEAFFGVISTSVKFFIGSVLAIFQNLLSSLLFSPIILMVSVVWKTIVWFNGADSRISGEPDSNLINLYWENVKYSVISSVVVYIIFLIPVAVLRGIIQGLDASKRKQKQQNEFEIAANQGILRSASNAGTIILIGGLFGSSTGCLIGLLAHQVLTWLTGGLILGLTIGLLVGILGGGGESAIQHFTLRIILFYQGYIPWNYARFLDNATDRLLLQRVGGRYRFIHRLLQEHFATMPLEK